MEREKWLINHIHGMRILSCNKIFVQVSVINLISEESKIHSNIGKIHFEINQVVSDTKKKNKIK